MKGGVTMDNETREMFNTLFDMMKSMQADISGLKQTVDKNSDDINGLRGEVCDLRGEVCGLRGEVHDLRGLIENEINKNIKIIAEGHQLQVDKLNDIQKVVENVRVKQELTEIRLNLLEADVKHLKHDN